MFEWIDVNDRVPSAGRGKHSWIEVLVWPRDHGDATAFYGTRINDRPCFYKFGARIENVTYWAPLPDGPAP